MIDTRTKIVPLEEAMGLVEQGAPLVAGYFDPLLPEQVERMEEAGPGLVVIVLDTPEAYLEARARAELAAALRSVRAVAIAPADAFPASPEELARRRAFLDYVRERAGQD